MATSGDLHLANRFLPKPSQFNRRVIARNVASSLGGNLINACSCLFLAIYLGRINQNRCLHMNGGYGRGDIDNDLYGSNTQHISDGILSGANVLRDILARAGPCGGRRDGRHHLDILKMGVGYFNGLANWNRCLPTTRNHIDIIFLQTSAKVDDWAAGNA